MHKIIIYSQEFLFLDLKMRKKSEINIFYKHYFAIEINLFIFIIYLNYIRNIFINLTNIIPMQIIIKIKVDKMNNTKKIPLYLPTQCPVHMQ